MRGHIHTDALHIVVFSGAVFAVAHVMRMAGGWLTAHGAPGIGNGVGGFFTLSGG